MERPQSSKARARIEAQRERILCAAQARFVECGFHAASMAGIAEEAGMSPGLIYRYFTSKNEIILAIIERQLELSRAEISGLRGSEDLAMDIWRIIGPTTTSENRMKPALHVEMSAEASRDPQIAAAVSESDQILRDEFGQWLRRSREQGGLGLSAKRARSVALLLQCLMDGLRVRSLREPDLDRSLVRRALQELLPGWLAED